MRFKVDLLFDFSRYGNRLPINYQYELSGWIYHTLAKGDEAYSGWLHENGYTKDRKQFKLFTFSNLQIPKLKMEGDRLVLLSDQAYLYLSFLPERATEEFIKGVFSSQSFVLGDRYSRVQCSVRGIEMVKPPVFEPVMIFRTISPMVLSGHLPDGKPTYISPDTIDAAKMIYDNLCSKYQAFYGKPFGNSDKNRTDSLTTSGESFSQEECNKAFKGKNSDKPLMRLNQNFSDVSGISFELLTPVKRKKITIKANTPQQTYIIGYNASFCISLPDELMRIMYETGVGEKGSMGFGMVEIIK